MIHTLFPFVSSKCNSSFFYRPRLCLVVFFLPNGLTLEWPTPEPSFEFVLIYPHFFNHRRVLKAIYVPMAFAFLFLVHTFLNLRFACPNVHFTSSHACLIGDFFLSWNVTSSPHPPSDPPSLENPAFPTVCILVNGLLFLPFAQLLASRMTSLFFSHPMSNPSTKAIGSTVNIYPINAHFSTLYCHDPSPSLHDSSHRLLQLAT